MTKEQILDALESLACSQGFYGRLLHNARSQGTLDALLTHLEEQNFNDTVDLVMYIEC